MNRPANGAPVGEGVPLWAGRDRPGARARRENGFAFGEGRGKAAPDRP
ncbi:MAG TPA: hypothetical protein VGV64_00225 [Thermoplasmata archaeon]|nr:hypothetical protein [Thermoplasmata archaeon]